MSDNEKFEKALQAALEAPPADLPLRDAPSFLWFDDPGFAALEARAVLTEISVELDYPDGLSTEYRAVPQ